MSNKLHIEIPLRNKVEAFFKGTDALLQFSNEVIDPIIKGLIKSNDKEQALIITYYRINNWIRALVLMNDTMYFQSVASGTRTILELLLDLNILYKHSDKYLKKYYAFNEIQKYYYAQKIKEFKNVYNLDESLYSIQIDYLKSIDISKIEQIIIDNWGFNLKQKPNKPKHWTGMTVIKRAELLGIDYLKLYHDCYHLTNWYVHSGLSGYINLKSDTIDALFGTCHRIAQIAFAEAIEICAKEFKISIAIDWFQEAINSLKLIPGKILIDYEVEQLKKLI